MDALKGLGQKVSKMQDLKEAREAAVQGLAQAKLGQEQIQQVVSKDSPQAIGEEINKISGAKGGSCANGQCGGAGGASGAGGAAQAGSGSAAGSCQGCGAQGCGGQCGNCCQNGRCCVNGRCNPSPPNEASTSGGNAASITGNNNTIDQSNSNNTTINITNNYGPEKPGADTGLNESQTVNEVGGAGESKGAEAAPAPVENSAPAPVENSAPPAAEAAPPPQNNPAQ